MSIAARTVYFETLVLGDHARIAAVDAESGIEVFVIGPATAARFELEILARRKLERALEQAGLIAPTSEATSRDKGASEPASPVEGTPRRGKLV